MRTLLAVMALASMSACSFRMKDASRVPASEDPLCWTSPVGPLLDGMAATVFTFAAIDTPGLFALDSTASEGQRAPTSHEILRGAIFEYVTAVLAVVEAAATLEGVRRIRACNAANERHHAWKQAHGIQ